VKDETGNRMKLKTTQLIGKAVAMAVAMAMAINYWDGQQFYVIN
jgi:Mor family transcriptional regulator